MANQVNKDQVPRATIRRLAAYVQALERILKDKKGIVSSEDLALACGVNAAQIRKDLAYFGNFGVRGVGYYSQDLLGAIRECLGIDQVWNVALVGLGSLGQSLLRYSVFRERGFVVVGVFDCDPFKIGQEISGLEVMSSRRLTKKAHELDIQIGIITSPADRAQRAADYLIEAGVKGIVNFTPVRLDVPVDIAVEYVDLVYHLFSVAFSVSDKGCYPE